MADPDQQSFARSVMSKNAIQLLQAIGLLDQRNGVMAIEEIDSNELKARLNYYHCKREEFLGKEVGQISANRPGNCSLLSSLSANKNVPSLGPKLLVQQALIVDDPVHDLAKPVSPMTQIDLSDMGLKPVDTIDLGKLRSALSYFAEVGRLIDAGMLHVLPLRTLHKAPDLLPVTLPLDRYRERVPPSTVEFVFSSVRIRPMELRDDNLVVLNHDNSERRPWVCIDFHNDASPYKNFYRYSSSEWEEDPDGTIIITWDSSGRGSVSEGEYEAWIEQSINQSVGVRLESIGREMHLADQIGATYLTESDFEAQLLAKRGQGKSPQDTAAINFLEANANMLCLGNLDSILRLRSDHEKLMERFRLSVENISEQLKGLQGGEFGEKAKRLFEAEVQPQIAEVNAAMQKLPEASAKGAMTTSVAIFLAILSGAALPAAFFISAAAVGTGAELVPAVGEYLRVRKQPQYVWHKLTSQ